AAGAAQVGHHHRPRAAAVDPVAPRRRRFSRGGFLKMPSFDTVSELDKHEVTNAVDQANRGLDQRFDFRGTGARYELDIGTFTITMKAQADFQLKQMLDILRLRLSRRGIDLSCMDVKDIDRNQGGTRQTVVL